MEDILENIKESLIDFQNIVAGASADLCNSVAQSIQELLGKL